MTSTADMMKQLGADIHAPIKPRETVPAASITEDEADARYPQPSARSELDESLLKQLFATNELSKSITG